MLYLTDFIISLGIGYVLAQSIAGKHAGERSERSLFFHTSRYRIHIHHWIWCLVVLLALVAFDITNPLLLGTLAGATAQGLTYSDRFSVILKK
jgi:hypothetical protein